VGAGAAARGRRILALPGGVLAGARGKPIMPTSINLSAGISSLIFPADRGALG
jgi:hypothetical protein